MHSDIYRAERAPGGKSGQARMNGPWTRLKWTPPIKPAAPPRWFLDQFEELRMSLSDEQLTHEAIEINHASVGRAST